MFVLDDPALIQKIAAKNGVPLPVMLLGRHRLGPHIEGRMLPRELGRHERVLIAGCIEDSDWPMAYAEFHPEELDQVHSVLRGLARKVEALGVEVDRIAHA